MRAFLRGYFRPSPYLPTFATTAPAGFAYDNGNVTNDGVNTYAYDAEGRLCAMLNGNTGIKTGYAYDGLGNRVAKGTVSSSTLTCDSSVFTPTTNYIVGLNGEQLDELDALGNPQHSNVYANGRLLATYAYSQSKWMYAFNDWLGSKRVTTDPARTMTETCLSLPFGDALNCSGGIDPSEHHFTGKERDAESGLDYFGARYMSSSMGRFMSPDPISFQARMLYDPQSFNLYSYVRNNPLSLTDPTGEAIELTGDDDARKKELDALKNGVGAKAGSYLYDNAQTDKNGVSTHYVGILSGGPDGKGPSFDSINSASGALSGIVNDSHTAALGVVNPGTEKEGVVIGPIPNTPGLTGDFGGKIMSYIMDTTQKSAGRLPGDMMSNGRPGEINSGILSFHELGHQMYQLQHPIASWFDNLTGGSRSNQQAVDLENKVRQTQHPNGPTRTEHDRQ
jgi:RHS repeat-associated protein